MRVRFQHYQRDLIEKFSHTTRKDIRNEKRYKEILVERKLVDNRLTLPEHD